MARTNSRPFTPGGIPFWGVPRGPSITSREALNHIPRPGNFPARSGMSARSGLTTNRNICSFGRRSRVTTQRRSGPVSGSSPSASTLMSSRIAPLSVVACLLDRIRRDFFDGSGLIVEPMRAGGHDDSVGGIFVHLLRADDLDQLVGGEVAQIVQRFHAFFAESD